MEQGWILKHLLVSNLNKHLQKRALSQVLLLISCILHTRQSGVGEIAPPSADVWAFCFVKIC